jgi:hypothetical protein
MPNITEDTSVMPPIIGSEITEERGIENIDLILQKMQNVIDKLPDDETRDDLRNCYKDIGKNCDIISKKLATSELKKLELQSCIEKDRTNMYMEQSRNRANILSQYLQKDLVATTVGAILLIILVMAYAMAMFLDVESPDILNNAFLLILGYFFGQAASKSTSVQKPE